MLMSVKSLLIGLPLLAQLGIGGGSVLALSASTVAYNQTKNCQKQPKVTSYYDEFVIAETPVITHEDGTLTKGTEKTVTLGRPEKSNIKHTVIKHCGKFISESSAAPVIVDAAVTTVKNLGTAYDEPEAGFIPFAVQQMPDSTQQKGSSGIRQKGLSGVKNIIYHYAKNEGEAETKTLVSESVVTPPIDEIDWYGTLVPHPSCSNGYYTNSNGVEVCSPSINNTGGATARCLDGTYSYSLNRSGTCSHHGGVAVWY